MTALRVLDGFTIGITADRRSQQQAELFERRGATVMHGPTIATEYLDGEGTLIDATREVIRHQPDYFVATTGTGVTAWFEAAHARGMGAELLASLGTARILARGPKAAAALQVAGLSVWALSPTEQFSDCVTQLRSQPLAGATVVVQEYGNQERVAMAQLEAAGAQVVRVPVYRWQLPADRAPARKLLAAVCDGRVDAITFTSAPALRHLFWLADDEGLTDRLRSRLNQGHPVIGCMGPVCADQARALDINFPVFPEIGRLGLLVRSVSEALQRRRVEIAWDGQTVALQGTALLIGDRLVQLSRREGAVLGALLHARGAVIPKTALLREIWGEEACDSHIVEMTVRRLRRRLGPESPRIVAVRSRGYRLAPS
ncbi:MAG: uroporphyrinogen-III synthase [Acidimicrobiales bacterium]